MLGSVRIYQIVAVLLLACVGARAQELAVTPSFKIDQYMPRTSALELRLSRALTPEEGRLAFFIDQTDLTALFAIEAERIVYQPEKLPLPSGEHQLIVFIVSPEGTWREIARTTIKVLTPAGFEKAMFKPGADFTGKAQPYNSFAPDQNAPTRETFQDGTLQMTVNTEHVRSGFTLNTNAQITGVTYRNEALRFGQLGEDAPPVDLGAYRIDLKRGTTVLSVGHLGFGSLRHLVNGFGSRGVALTFGEGRRFSLQLAALNGSSIVGWDNFVGLDEDDHRVYGATVGAELIPSRPGGLRLEGTYFSGSLLPLSGFNQGAVLTAEKSDGLGFRIVASHPTQRFTVDAGYTGSTFHEANDSEVEDGLVVTPIPSRTNDAQYLEASLVLLRNRAIAKVPTSLTLTARHERVEPLFRSVGAFVQADLQTNGADLNGTFGPLSMQLGHTRLRDNLGGVDSILTTKTERSALGISLPLNAVIRGTSIKPAWLPMLIAQMDSTHQYGTGVPVNSGFDPTSVPDQVSTNGSASLQWQFGSYNVGYRFSQAHQDNRQTGRGNADFTTTSNALTFGFAVAPRLTASLDVSFDEGESEAENRVDRTQRYGTTITWTMFGQTALGANITTTTADNNFGTIDNRGTVGFLELSSGFRLTRSADANRLARVFVRYSAQDDRSINRDFGLDSDRNSATIISGLTLSMH